MWESQRDISALPPANSNTINYRLGHRPPLLRLLYSIEKRFADVFRFNSRVNFWRQSATPNQNYAPPVHHPARLPRCPSITINHRNINSHYNICAKFFRGRGPSQYQAGQPTKPSQSVEDEYVSSHSLAANHLPNCRCPSYSP